MGNGEFKVSEQKWKDLFEGRLMVFVLLLDIHAFEWNDDPQ